MYVEVGVTGRTPRNDTVLFKSGETFQYGPCDDEVLETGKETTRTKNREGDGFDTNG